MDVYVYLFGVHFKVDEVRYLFSHRQQTFESTHYSLIEIGMLHIPSVDEKVLLGSFFPGSFGLSYKACYFTQCGFHLYGEKVLVDAFTEYIHYALAKM